MKILVHLVSGQNLPDYIASKIINPDKELFLYTAESGNSLKNLQAVLFNHLEPVKIDPWDYEGIYKQSVEIITTYPGDTVILNFTCGNKIMSQAAFEAFRQANLDCIYINTQSDEYLYFTNSGGEMNISRQQLLVEGNLRDFIRLNGQEVNLPNFVFTGKQERLINFLTGNFNSMSKAIFKFAQQYKKGEDRTWEATEGKLKGTLIELKNKKSTIRFVEHGTNLFEVSEDDDLLITLLCGGWFEVACFKALNSLQFFNELVLNAKMEKLTRGDKDKFEDKNEADIIGMQGIYPVLFECKSGGIHADHINKLLSLKQTYLGRYASLYFITYYPLRVEDEYQRLLLEKMTDNGIRHILYKDINSEFKKSLKARENLK